MAHNAAVECGGKGVEFVKHFWRRPTIALMSNQLNRSSFDLNSIPKEFVNYFVNDFNKNHLKEILNARDGSSVVIDFTRDIHTGVVDLGGGCFVMNPMDGVGIVDGLSEESMTEDIARKIFNGNKNTISFYKDSDEFFHHWMFYAEKFLSEISRKFKNVILLEIYFTSKTLSGGHDERYVSLAHDANIMLEKMYKFSESFDVEIVRFDRRYFQTGSNVPWGGPSPTHFTQETICLFSEGIRKIILPEAPFRGELIVGQAFKRAQEAEKLRFSLAEVQVELASKDTALSEVGDALEASREEVRASGAALQHALEDVAGATSLASQKVLEAENANLEVQNARRSLEEAILEGASLAQENELEKSRHASTRESLNVSLKEVAFLEDQVKSLKDEIELLKLKELSPSKGGARKWTSGAIKNIANVKKVIKKSMRGKVGI